MPGRHHTPALAMPATGISTGPRAGKGAVLPRVAAVAVLVAAIGTIAGFAGYAGGRGSVDRDALREQGYQAGRLAATHTASARAAVPPHGGSVSASARTVRPVASRGEVARAFAAGRRSGLREASVAERAHSRSLGASAALGGFPSGWVLGRWYLVTLDGGGTPTGGGPRVAQRIGPIAPGQAYSACRGGTAVCPVTGPGT